MLGGGSVGAQLQKTCQRAHVSTQSTSWRCLGKVNDCVERGSWVFHCFMSCACACTRSQVFVMSAKRHGIRLLASCLPSLSALSLPLMLQWNGHQVMEICQPRVRRFSMDSRAHWSYFWLCLLKLSVTGVRHGSR